MKLSKKILSVSSFHNIIQIFQRCGSSSILVYLHSFVSTFFLDLLLGAQKCNRVQILSAYILSCV